MDKKEIQEQRIKGYFIDAAKELLKGEGLSVVSVRSVADKAGYSYATLYNYFKDLNDLIFECVRDFQAECETAVKSKIKKSGQGKDKIKATVQAYVEYFTEYSGVFELFFLERMGNIGNKQSISELIYTFLDRLCEPHWKYCIAQNIFDRELADKKKRQLRFCVMGMLLFYQNRFQPENYNKFIEVLNNQMEEIIGTSYPTKNETA
ncbi:MAG: TetR/AcrR family transcriptional regulator [Bacteroidales bacterium]|jgi:AcrR family transcriptional regulator|nr:TetR/AcrR family transcriptional regulator [Bacteroidales bacterium]